MTVCMPSGGQPPRNHKLITLHQTGCVCVCVWTRRSITGVCYIKKKKKKRECLYKCVYPAALAPAVPIWPESRVRKANRRERDIHSELVSWKDTGLTPREE